jgi:hypothetical protein
MPHGLTNAASGKNGHLNNGHLYMEASRFFSRVQIGQRFISR